MLDGEVLDLPRDASRILGWAPDGQSLLYTRHEVGDLPTESVWRLYPGPRPWLSRVAPRNPARFIYSVAYLDGKLLHAESNTRVITLPGDEQQLDLVVADPWNGEIVSRTKLPPGVMPVNLRLRGASKVASE